MSDVDLGPDKDQANYIVHQDEPINAEPSAAKLADRWETPAKLAYMRNHGEVLHLDKQAYQLRVDIEPDLQPSLVRSAPLAGQTSVGLEEILESGRRTLDAALQCAGNRRKELDERHEVEGIKWKSGTVLNAKWSGECMDNAALRSRLTGFLFPYKGVYLRDFLLRLGMPENLEESASGLQDAHVYFTSYQSCEQADKYEVSIPLKDAM